MTTFFFFHALLHQTCMISVFPYSTWFPLNRVTHICVSDLTSIGSDNGLSPGRRQAIIRTNAGILFIRPLGAKFSEFLVEFLNFSLQKMRLKVSSAKRRPFCLGLNELNVFALIIPAVKSPAMVITTMTSIIILLKQHLSKYFDAIISFW